jgi:hypothetical protein
MLETDPVNKTAKPRNPAPKKARENLRTRTTNKLLFQTRIKTICVKRTKPGMSEIIDVSNSKICIYTIRLQPGSTGLCSTADNGVDARHVKIQHTWARWTAFNKHQPQSVTSVYSRNQSTFKRVKTVASCCTIQNSIKLPMGFINPQCRVKVQFYSSLNFLIIRTVSHSVNIAAQRHSHAYRVVAKYIFSGSKSTHLYWHKRCTNMH